MTLLYAFPGVPIFFIISGFLIARSLERGDLRRYARNRFLRMYPALWACLAVSIAILVAHGVITRAYATTPTFWAWFLGQMTVVHAYNPAECRSFGVGAINGSLWAIPLELGFYVALPTLMAVRARFVHSLRLPTFLLIVAAAAATLYGVAAPWKPASPLARAILLTTAPHLWVFLLGTLAHYHGSACGRSSRAGRRCGSASTWPRTLHSCVGSLARPSGR